MFLTFTFNDLLGLSQVLTPPVSSFHTSTLRYGTVFARPPRPSFGDASVELVIGTTLYPGHMGLDD